MLTLTQAYFRDTAAMSTSLAQSIHDPALRPKVPANVLSATAVLAVVNTLTRMMSFLMVPLYAHFLRPAEFGLVDLFQVSTFLMGMLVSFQMPGGLMRYLQSPERLQAELGNTASPGQHSELISSADVFSNGLMLILAGNAAFAVLGSLLLPFVAGFWPALAVMQPYWTTFLLFLLGYTLLEYGKQLCRSQQLVKSVVMGEVLQTGLLIALNVVLVVSLHWGMSGFLASLIISQMVVLGYFIWQGRWHTLFNGVGKMTGAWLGLSIKPLVMKRLLAFSIPLIPAVVSLMLMGYIDRILVVSLRGLDEAGLYAIGLKIAMILSFFNQAFHQSASMYLFNETDEDTVEAEADPIACASEVIPGKHQHAISAEKLQTLQHLFHVQWSMCLVLSTLSLLFIKPVFALTLPHGFYQSWVVIPFVLVWSTAYGVSSFLSMGLMIQEKTITIMVINAASLALNIGLCLWMIPLWGMVGAAAASALSFITMTLVMRWLVRHTLPVSLPPRLWLASVVFAGMIALFYVDVPMTSPALWPWLGGMGLGAVGLCLLCLPDLSGFMSIALNKIRALTQGPQAS